MFIITLLSSFVFFVGQSCAQLATKPIKKKVKVDVNTNTNVNAGMLLSPTFWTKAPGLPTNIIAHDIQLWNNKFYLSTNKGIYRRGLLHTDSWELFPNNVTGAMHVDLKDYVFTDAWINPNDANELLFLSTTSSNSTLWTIKKQSASSINKGSTINTPSSYASGTSTGSTIGRFTINSSSANIYSISKGKTLFLDKDQIVLNGSSMKPSTGFKNGVITRSYYINKIRGNYRSFGYIDSDRSGKKYSVLLGGNGFVMRDATTATGKSWQYIDKGLKNNCGQITAIESWPTSSTHYIGTKKGHVYKTTNNGSTWRYYSQGALNPSEYVTEIYNLDGHIKFLYAATNRGVFVTNRESNTTASWSLYGSLPNGAKAKKVFITLNEVLVSTDKGVYRKSVKK